MRKKVYKILSLVQNCIPMMVHFRIKPPSFFGGVLVNGFAKTVCFHALSTVKPTEHLLETFPSMRAE